MVNISDNQKKRELWLDALKGIAIVCVVLGHVLKGNIQVDLYPRFLPEQRYAMDLVYSFHMPLFFALSGYAYFKYINNDSNKQDPKIKKNVINLLLLYVIYNVSLCIFKMIFSAFVNNSFSFEEVIENIFLPTTPLWYIYILIFYYLLFWKMPKIREGSFAVWVIFFIAGIFGKHLLVAVDAPTCFVRFIYYLQFFWIGNCIYEAKNVLQNIDRRIIWITIVVAILFVFIYWSQLLHGHDYAFFKQMCSYGMITLLLFFSLFYESRYTVFSHLLHFLALFGEKSLYIFLLHTYFVTANRYLFIKMHIDVCWLEILSGLFIGLITPLLLYRLLGYWPRLRHALFEPGKVILRERK